MKIEINHDSSKTLSVQLLMVKIATNTKFHPGHERKKESQNKVRRQGVSNRQ